jgi:quercetin dioxygenase-like cupin family protein
MRIAIFLGLTLGLSSVAAANAQPTPYPGFSCATLAQRQKLAGAPGLTFRVVKTTWSASSKPLPHRHRFGEILYLLSGSGTNTMNGKTLALSADSAIVVPADTDHAIAAKGDSPVTLLAVQFTDAHSPAWSSKTDSGPSVCHD